MVTDGAMAAVERELRKYAGDERMKSLFIWGAYADGQRQQCECCGALLLVLEVATVDTFPRATRQWVEPVSEATRVPELMFRQHTPERCKQLRHGGNHGRLA